MWGEILEEDNYDPKEDFYNAAKAAAEMNKRKTGKEKLLGKTSSRRMEAGTVPANANGNLGSKRLKVKKRIVYTYEYASDD